MLQPSDSQKSTQFSSTPNSLAPGKTVGAPMEQAMIGRSLTIKGEVSGSESLYIDGRIEGSISSVEDGAVLKGSVQVRSAEIKHDKTQNQAKTAEQSKPLASAAHA